MSSALDISLREPNRKKIQGVIFADSGTAGGSLDVPIGKDGAWLFSARRSYLDVAFDLAGMAEQGLIGYPRTVDLTNKFIYDITPRHKLSFTALNFFENFDQSDEQASNWPPHRPFSDAPNSSALTGGNDQHHLWYENARASHDMGEWLTNDGTFYIPYSSITCSAPAIFAIRNSV